MDIKVNFKKDFPILQNNGGLVYLDNAATTQKPQKVIDAIKDFYENDNSNIHRGIYDLSERATNKYEGARKKVAEFIGAKSNCIVFTKNATEGFNLIANGVLSIAGEGKNEIVLTEMEHHSNILPWQKFAKKNDFVIKYIPIKKDLTLDYEKAKELINENTAIVSFVHVSNVLGTKNDVSKLIDLAKSNDAISIVDGTQSIGHEKINVEKMGCDFFLFSSHKMYGPHGVGVLYGKQDVLKKLPVRDLGGGIVQGVTKEDYNLIESPYCFESGTENIAGVIALSSAIDYLEEVGMDNISKYEKELSEYFNSELSKLDFIKTYHVDDAPIFSFNVISIHPHDVATILNEENICVRAGHHCCMILMDQLSENGLCRASLGIYNTKEDVDKLIKALIKVKEIFKLEEEK